MRNAAHGKIAAGVHILQNSTNTNQTKIITSNTPTPLLAKHTTHRQDKQTAHTCTHQTNYETYIFHTIS